MGRLIDADKLSFYGFFDAGDYSIVRQTIYDAPTVEAIPKADYETRLKADMVAMLTEIQLEIVELKSYESADGQDLVMLADIGTLFQQKINALKAKSEE